MPPTIRPNPTSDSQNLTVAHPLIAAKRLSISFDANLQDLTWPTHLPSKREREGNFNRTDATSLASAPWNFKMKEFYLNVPQEPYAVSSRSIFSHMSRVKEENEENSELQRHRGKLTLTEEHDYKLSKAQLKASSNTSALLVGFAMVALVELHYDDETPHTILMVLGIVTTLLVAVHLLALMMSTCILPHMEASGPTQDSPHIRLRFFIKLSWLFSTCIGLILFLIEIAVISFMKFHNAKFDIGGWVTTLMMIPVFFVFVLFSYWIHRSRAIHSMERLKYKERFDPICFHIGVLHRFSLQDDLLNSSDRDLQAKCNI